MFFILIVSAVLSGLVSFAVLWPYGSVLGVIGAPVIASLVSTGIVLCLRSAKSSRPAIGNAPEEAEGTALLKLDRYRRN
ncbi:hypothetical protein [Microvirga roseola]|uniref:hypothetical protein n=1 Tax=Microvirga roseola TaxID=2883126 RepID=UPI001E5EA0D7|nr:hypothetical protein [Microvirga roseola]